MAKMVNLVLYIFYHSWEKKCKATTLTILKKILWVKPF